jgi:hypothetical protein
VWQETRDHGQTCQSGPGLRIGRSRPNIEHMSESSPQTDPSAEKDPSDWVTGDEPATGPQKSYLQTLAREAGEEVPDDLSKADASRKIDELQDETGRGQ